MQILTAHYDGKVIVPDQPPDFPTGTRLRLTVEPMEQSPSPPTGKLELPILTGVDPQIVRTIMQDHEFDLDNAKIEAFLRPVV